MRKLIETKGTEIVCDYCDYKTQTTREDYPKYLNKPCPKCGENLLTDEDFKKAEGVFKTADFINRWFSWILIFKKKPLDFKIIRVHTHNGVEIDEVENVGD